MKVTFVTPLVERNVNIQMTMTEAKLLRKICRANVSVPSAVAAYEGSSTVAAQVEKLLGDFAAALAAENIK